MGSHSTIPRKRKAVGLVVNSFLLAVYVTAVAVYVRGDGPLWASVFLWLLIGWQVIKLILIARAKTTDQG